MPCAMPLFAGKTRGPLLQPGIHTFCLVLGAADDAEQTARLGLIKAAAGLWKERFR